MNRAAMAEQPEPRPAGSTQPRVCIGIPTYNGGRHLQEAVGSLLDQTFRDVRFVLVDDGSQDSTADVARGLSRLDERLDVQVNPVRRGMVANWNRALERAQATAPEAEFFAWASDHDRWHTTWLAELVAALDADPGAVLAYPRSGRFDERGERPGGRWSFDTADVPDASERLRRAARRMSAGDMVYGLFRLAALRAAGPFPSVIYPDRLLMARLAAEGRFVQVPEVLWCRRVTRPSTPRRQRRTLFPDGAVPWHARLPWWSVHARLLAREAGPVDAMTYAAAGAWLAARSVPSRLRQHLEHPALRPR